MRPSGGAYTLDGRATTATATARLSPASTNGVTGDQLTVLLDAQPAGKPHEYVRVIFNKPAGAADSRYALLTVVLDGQNAPGDYYDKPATGALTKTPAGNWSGTFTGTFVDGQGHPLSTITQGSFTEVAL